MQTLSLNFGNIASRWRELHGQPSCWSGLLDPLDSDLRRQLLLYGAMCQSAYDGFCHLKGSKCVGRSKFVPADFFSQTGLQSPGTSFPYQITRFLYATATLEHPFLFRCLSRDREDTEVNFMGFVAVATDEAVKVLGRRDIVLVWRGTVEKIEWAKDLDFIQVSTRGLLPKSHKGIFPGIMRGWVSIYTSSDTDTDMSRISARVQALSEVQRLVDLYKEEVVSITVVGHSLGAALATLNAVDITANGYNIPSSSDTRTPAPVTAFLFASPRVGDPAFQDLATAQSHLRVLRVSNHGDLVPHLPIHFPIRLLDYVDMGEELHINTAQSPFLKKSAPKHSLEIYLHGVAGVISNKKNGFLEMPTRDIALVNRYHDALKSHYGIPKYWWVEKEKGEMNH